MKVPQVPQTTTPLTKLVRTTEGILVVASNVLLVVLGAVGDMAWTKVGLAAAILNAVTITARSILKGVATLNPIIGDPIAPAGFEQVAEMDAPLFTGGSGVEPEPGSE